MEYEAQFFGFTSHGFINFFFNNLVECWAVTVEKNLYPSLMQLVESSTTKKISPKKKKMFRNKLLDRLFQNGKLNVILTEAQKHLTQYIFKIPKNVTLPEDEQNLSVETYDEQELLNQIEELTNEIIELQQIAKELKIKRRNRELLAKIDA